MDPVYAGAIAGLVILFVIVIIVYICAFWECRTPIYAPLPHD